jgi:hypothetical protein
MTYDSGVREIEEKLLSKGFVPLRAVMAASHLARSYIQKLVRVHAIPHHRYKNGLYPDWVELRSKIPLADLLELPQTAEGMKPFLGPKKLVKWPDTSRADELILPLGLNGRVEALLASRGGKFAAERTAVGPTSADAALLSDASKEAKEIVAQFKRSYGRASVETTDGDRQTTEEKRPRKRPRAAVKSRAPRMPRAGRKIDSAELSGTYLLEGELEAEDLGTSLGRQLEAEDSGSRVDSDWEDPGESADIEPESATVAEYRKRTLEGIQRRLRTRPRDR